MWYWKGFFFFGLESNRTMHAILFSVNEVERKKSPSVSNSGRSMSRHKPSECNRVNFILTSLKCRNNCMFCWADGPDGRSPMILIFSFAETSITRRNNRYTA